MLTSVIPDVLGNFAGRSDLSKLILSGVSRRVAMTLIHLFSPVYIYITLSESGTLESYAILFVFVYYFLTFIIKILTQVISEDLSREIGFKAVIRLSLLPFLLFATILIFASDYPTFFLLAAVFSGVHIGLFWWGYHGYFAKKGHKDHFGRKVGEANLLETLASVVTPIGGAAITYFFGFPAIFILSCIFMFFSIKLLGKGSKTRQATDVEISEVVELIRTHKSISIAYVGMAAEGIISAVVWPMFLFLFFQKIVSLGFVVSLAAVVASVFSIVIGDWVDRQGERKIVGIGSPVLFCSWLLRFLTFSFPVFVIGDSLRNFGQRMIFMPLNALSYKKAQVGSARAILFFEITQAVGVLFSLLLVIVLVFLKIELYYVFLIASIFSLFPMIAVLKKRLSNVYTQNT